VTDASRPFSEEDADADPFGQFERWFAEAVDVGTSQPEAAALATATPNGRPSVRMVLVKQTGRGGFVFYTNYESRKGTELAANPRAALLFHWEMLGRQVRLEGPVQRTTREESLAYAHSRPRGSQLSAAASPQSRPVPDRAWLEQRVAELDAQYADAEVPLSDSWGGFRLGPERFEFWQHRVSRLHDRFVYTPEPDGGWKVQRLAP
jgi:pyridoxamine 5'-phosphate oxidase